MMLEIPDTVEKRRRFLKLALAGASVAATSLSTPAAASTVQTATEVRSVNLYNLHTKEHLKIAYAADGKYLQDNLTELNFFLRDHRQNEATLMDARLFDQLWEIRQGLGENPVFEIISAYRSPKTNAMLRARSRNVARRSFHILGKALDIRVQGVSTRRLRNQALALKAGGVGYYPGSRFVHIDTGPVRNWRS